MDLEPDMLSHVDEPEPAWGDDPSPRAESLWLARARAQAARSEPHEPPAAAAIETAAAGPMADAVPPSDSSSPIDTPAPDDATWFTLSPAVLEASEETPVRPDEAEVADTDVPEPRDVRMFVDPALSVERSAAADAPWLVPVASTYPEASEPAPLESARYEPSLEAEPSVIVPAAEPSEADALEDAPSLALAEVHAPEVYGEAGADLEPGPEPIEGMLVVAAPHPAAIGRPPLPSSSWSLGHFAGAAIAAVGGAVIVLTMMVPRGTPSAPASPTPAPAPVTAGRPAHPAGAAVVVETPRWRATSEWTGGRKKSVAYELAADRPVRLWMRQFTPVLVVRCLAGTLDTFVVTGSASAIERGRTDHTVRLAFDESPELVERWGDSAERDGLFAPNGRSVLSRASDARRLRFTFTPHNAPAAEASFSVAGIDALEGPLTKHCR